MFRAWPDQDAPLQDWSSVAVNRARAHRSPAVFWL
ncbi:NADP-dependent isocitrate dehydrogenase [Kitasatospora albolonga]